MTQYRCGRCDELFEADRYKNPHSKKVCHKCRKRSGRRK